MCAQKWLSVNSAQVKVSLYLNITTKQHVTHCERWVSQSDHYHRLKKITKGYSIIPHSKKIASLATRWERWQVLCILEYPDANKLLYQRTKLISKCWHLNKFLFGWLPLTNLYRSAHFWYEKQLKCWEEKWKEEERDNYSILTSTQVSTHTFLSILIKFE